MDSGWLSTPNSSVLVFLNRTNTVWHVNFVTPAAPSLPIMWQAMFDKVFLKPITGDSWYTVRVIAMKSNTG